MKKLLIPFFMLTLFSLSSCCYEEECGACFTPPNYFVFELVDSDTGENLFTNRTFDSDDIEVLDASDHSIEFAFIEENDINLIEINTIGWQTEIVNYRINIGSENIFDLYVDAKRLSEDCCSFTRYNEIEIGNTDFSLSAETGIYTILVD
ncbi:hypothetical protein DWB61_15040 [Ancylomarina euxinus]|uniref:Uncharacterized protein n=1 Tax=Ancylomarina euxinus TaxID=2283627 RepID=A0A425XXS9_9BACT|nr:hypothetical protein [Ancylomarina euxinus]MCZ4696032.1 hypothetical protein [Ancylomarina euxinus]MUP13971.1 hypothetical protein [Ancylomarina euxinus]RRG19525.1 hypothetical protein DWB61_15040 [Ancylomarina euxinus]